MWVNAQSLLPNSYQDVASNAALCSEAKCGNEGHKTMVRHFTVIM